MFENRRTSRPFDFVGPINPSDYTDDVPLGNNDATVRYAKIYDTPGNTPLNRVKGNLVELPGKYTWKGDPFTNAW